MKGRALILALFFITNLAYADCTDEVRTLVDSMLPYAEQIAGKKIDVRVQLVAGDKGMEEENAAAEYVFSESGGKDTIKVQTPFCGLPAASMRASIAHELGHGIDRQRITLYNGMGSPWPRQPTEISATARAVEIYGLAGWDLSDFEGLFGVSDAFKNHLIEAIRLSKNR